MRRMRCLILVALAGVGVNASLAGAAALAGEPSAVRLPEGVKAVWDFDKAHRETTPTRQRVCLNGLWRWQPCPSPASAPPTSDWGYFKVPGCWPGITDYMQKDCQTVYPHPSWKDEKLGAITAAWHQREITVPADWAGRRIALRVAYLNSHAAVFIDGKPAGVMYYPGGELDVTALCRPGDKHTLTLMVAAMPLKAVMLSYNDTAAAREVKGSVARRGLCGDVYLDSTPAGPRIGDVRIETSVRRGEIVCDVALHELKPKTPYVLRARITAAGRAVKEIASGPFTAEKLKAGPISLAAPWRPERLWDVHTPTNTYQLAVSLHDGDDKLLDASHAERFGFREFWIDGRDFYLNGTRLFLSGVPLDNALVGASAANYEATCESLRRLQSFGINFVYTHNYGCEPGSHLSYAEVLRAADDVGMLVSFSQPHFAHYDWRTPEAEANNGYARHAAFYVREAQNHPSVVCYSMSHNATGYSEDMNPHMIDGVQDARDQWARNNAALAERAAAIVRRLDPGRFVYHHASGNLGPMHLSNFYPNFVPVQEMCDWFEHWSTRGVKPVFTCEYGAPFTWDWTMYRGWYKGQRSFGSARVPWEFCFAEWNAQFLGDRAYRISEPEKANLRWEAKQFRAGNLWHRWDYPYEVGSRVFDDRYAVFAQYVRDNWRAMRTWGVSANSPWEHGHFWRLREGVDKGRKTLKVDWDNLQRPGFSPDYIDARYERMDLAFERSDWIATPAAEALVRNNGPLLAYLGGKPDRFTSKDHNFAAGETIDKQLILINNSREPVEAEWTCAFGEDSAATGRTKVRLPAGGQERLPLRFRLPDAKAPATHRIHARVDFGNRIVQEDSFDVHVVPSAPPPAIRAPVALYDPKGETARWLDAQGVKYQRVAADADLSAFELLIVGKAALTPDGPGPDVGRVRDGLKVIVFEQTSETLERRFGFRVVEYGLRNVVRRVSDHPLLAGLADEHLRDWRGEATILPPRLSYQLRPQHGPTVAWCGIPVSRAWRCGNYGNLASVLIEKPARGDFLPIVDGGYALQYSPLMEYREGKGVVLFCQMDVTARSESDPAAERLARNLLDYAAGWKPLPRRTLLYTGGEAGRQYLEKAGVPFRPFDGGPLKPDEVLLAAPGGEMTAGGAERVKAWLSAGGRLLAVGLDASDANALVPVKVTMQKAEHIATCFEPFAAASPLAGIGPADVHSRDPRSVPLVTGGASAIGDGVLAEAESGRVVFLQLPPWEFSAEAPMNQKRTFRRTAVALARLLAGMGAAGSTPILDRFARPAEKDQQRWLDGLYLDRPEEWDDPYRFFRW